jgi:hypothetical protein
MCKHLLLDSGLGVFSDPEQPNDPYPDAWCSECERIRIEKGVSGMFNDDYARSVFKLVCGECYKEIKARNLITT